MSERTVEENILKKANQKRLLGDLAIDGGNFTTAQLKSKTIRDLFNVEGEEVSLDNTGATSEAAEDENEPVGDKKSMGAFESAIAAVEDATDTEVILNFFKSSPVIEFRSLRKKSFILQHLRIF